VIHFVVQGLLASIFVQEVAPPETKAPLELKGVIELPAVEGRIDHLSVDLARERLFVAALGNDSVEVVDLKAGKHLQSLHGVREPQGVVYLADCDRVVVTSGKAGTCDVFDGDTLKSVTRFAVGDDADNLRYDARHERLYVGYGEGSIGGVDVKSWNVVERIALEGHPESFQLDPDSGRVFVNVPDAHQIAVIHLAEHKVLTTWNLDEASANFPMALVPSAARPEGGLLFVGCRSPAKLVLRSTATGKSAGAVELSGDVDDVFYDAKRHRVYAICGEGSVDVIREEQGALERTSRFATAAGARTGLYVPERSELFVAVPHRGSQLAEVRILRVKD
jgi:hypothetical protein